MLEKIAKKVSKATAGFLAATILANGCIPPKYSWGSGSVVDVKYEKISEKVKPEEKTKYALSADVAENLLTIHVSEEMYDVHYDILRAINIEKQQQQKYKISTGASVAQWSSLVTGLGLLSAGAIVRLNTGTLFTFSPESHCGEFPSSYLTDFVDYSSWQSSQGNYDRDAQDWYDCYADYVRERNTGNILLGTGASIGAIGVTIPIVSKKSYRPIREFREVENQTNTLKEKEATTILNKSYPGINVPVQVSSKYFTINGNDKAVLHTDATGSTTARLDSYDPNFAFSLSGLADTTIAEQLRAAGYKNSRFLPKLQETALPISYDVAIETNMQDGDTVSITVPVKGLIVKDSALEQIIMGL